MSPVDRAGSVSEISPRHSFSLQNFAISMCSYEKAGWPGYRDLGNRAGNFSYMNTSRPNTGTVRNETFSTAHGFKIADKSERGYTDCGGLLDIFKFPI